MEVTTFQPMRPPEMWSSDATMRAAWKGVKKVLETVLIRPMRVVARAIAAMAVSGSRYQRGPSPMLSVDWPSAKKMASSLPRSAVRANAS
ncbi:hypothetical protein D3C71_1681090 [compost metagenome]